MSYEMVLPYRVSDAGEPADLPLWHSVQQFLFQEAALLDRRAFAEWLDMLDDGIRYWAPTRYSRTPRERAGEWSRPDQAAHFDDSKQFLALRVRRLLTDRAWSEDAPSRTRHLVTNVQVRRLADGAIEADSNFLVYRGRVDDCEEIFSGARHDRLVGSDGPYPFRIAERVILFDHTMILANNLGIFF
ncbi:MAG: aromatic-ring-hydroxylating dioxygenase subunit beta [Sphingobium sp.]|uniref:aromatic-ring-hydroxylating dioxygenase subunit beta n=1 Tax=Sphingobium sp. TaxID=1912891 RepID=UPI002E238C43